MNLLALFRSIDRRIFTCIGCGCIHLVIGTIYTTGNIIPYINSRIMYESGAVSNVTMSITAYISVLTWSISFQHATWIMTRWTPKKAIYIGNTLFIIVVYIASSLKDKYSIIIVYGVVLGLASGTSYAPALMTAISCYPEKKGIITGCVIMCFAAGAFFFNFITTAICNPKNEEATVSVTVDGVANKYFPRDVADNVEKMFLIIASCYVVLTVIGLLLIKDFDFKAPVQNTGPLSKEQTKINAKKEVKPENDENEDNEENEEGSSRSPHKVDGEDKDEDIGKQKTLEFTRQQTVFANPDLELNTWQSFQTRQFWQVFVFKMLSGTAGLFAIASFKTIGINYGYKDQYLTTLGSVGSALNGFLRPGWGLLIDKITYKYTYMIICAIQVCITATFPAIKTFSAAFFIWICILYPCSGGHFTLLAPIAIRVYGRITGARVYSFFVFSLGVASMIAYLLQVYVTKSLSYDAFFWILSGLSACSFTSNLFFSETIRT